MNPKGLNGNQLKLIALVTMTIDHMGMMLLPQYPILRIIGRLAYPIFAYMIAEGCFYTRSMGRYLGTVAVWAGICQGVYLFAMGSLYQCILVTFMLSIGLVLLIKNAREKKNPVAWGLVVAALVAVIFICEVLPLLLSGTDFSVDYGSVGVLMPVLIYLGKDKKQKLLLAAAGLCCLALSVGWVQWFSLPALVLLALYNGQRGKANLKYLFYIYFPAHLLALYVIGLLVL